MRNEHGYNIQDFERKIKTVGSQTRWWGTFVLLVGVVMAIFEVSGGIVITALGFVVALQGAIIRYAFK